MGLREKMEEHPVLSGSFGVACITLSVLITVVFGQEEPPPPKPRVTSVYFLNVESKQYYQMALSPQEELSPLQVPDGQGKAMRAFVFGCGDCEKENLYVGFLEKFSSEYKRMRKQLRGRMNENQNWILEQGHLVGNGYGKGWVQARSHEGVKLIQAALDPSLQCSNGKTIRRCHPPEEIPWLRGGPPDDPDTIE